VSHVAGRYETLWGRVVRPRTLNPSDVPERVDEVGRSIGAELEAQGLAP
jgi:hypothetical protein